MKLIELPDDYKELLPTREEMENYFRGWHSENFTKKYFDNDLEYPNLPIHSIINERKQSPYKYFWSMVENANSRKELPPLSIKEGYNPGFNTGVRTNGFGSDTMFARAILKKGELVDYLQFNISYMTNCGMWLFHNIRFPDNFDWENHKSFLNRHLKHTYNLALDTKHYALATHNYRNKKWFESHWEELKETVNPNSGHKINVWLYSK